MDESTNDEDFPAKWAAKGNVIAYPVLAQGEVIGIEHSYRHRRPPVIRSVVFPDDYVNRGS